METTPWIEHLTHPLVLFGFTLFIIAGLVRVFNPEKLNGKATSQLLHKSLNYSFIIALFIVVLGFAYSALPALQTPQTKVKQESIGLQSGNTANHVPQGAAVEQTSKGDQSPNFSNFAK